MDHCEWTNAHELKFLLEHCFSPHIRFKHILPPGLVVLAYSKSATEGPLLGGGMENTSLSTTTRALIFWRMESWTCPPPTA
jgi:hypothetical protein